MRKALELADELGENTNGYTLISLPKYTMQMVEFSRNLLFEEAPQTFSI